MFGVWTLGVVLPTIGVESVPKSDRLEEVLDKVGTKRKNWPRDSGTSVALNFARKPARKVARKAASKAAKKAVSKAGWKAAAICL